MSLLFRQHQAFVAIQARLQWEENSASGRCPHDLAGSSVRVPGSVCIKADTGVEQRRFPSDRGRRTDQGPGSQTWKGDLDLPVDPQGPASAGRANRHTGVRHETAPSQIQGTCSSLGPDPPLQLSKQFGFCSFAVVRLVRTSF